MPTVRFVPQPQQQHGDVLIEGLTDDRFTEFLAIVAWAKSSGLRRIRSALDGFRSRGGNARLVIGIDEHGGTWEGLELALALFDVVYVFHDRGTRTFHPKIYLVEGQDAAIAAVGSANLTKGGLFTNYEASLVLEMDLTDEVDRLLLGEFHNYFSWFRDIGDQCRLLTEELIDDLRRDPTLTIVSERERGFRSRSSRSRSTAGATPIFGTPISGLSSAPSPQDPGPEDNDDNDSVMPQRIGPVAPAPSATAPAQYASPGAATFSRGFYKSLSNNDVSLTSSPGQMIIPIEFLDFFPALANEKGETATGGPMQLAAEFPVRFIDGTYVKDVAARVIYYQPASDHPRQNVDIRFTFRDHEVLQRLDAHDILVFEDGAAGIAVTRRPAGWLPGNWGWL